MNKLYNDTAVQAIANAIRAKNGSSDTYTIAEMSTALNDLSYYAKPTISNVALATFEADGLPLNTLKVSVEAKQDLHGYDKPWVGGAGKNKLPLVLADIKAINTSGTWSGNVYTISGTTFAVMTDDADNVTGIKINGTTSGGINFNLADGVSVPLNNSYKFFGCNSFSSGVGAITYSFSGASDVNAYGSAVTSTISATFTHAHIYLWSGKTFNNVMVYPMFMLASESDDTFAPYSNICPISGWDVANVSDVDDVENPTVTQTTTITLPQTVYGAEVDVVNGILKITDGYIASYNGETLPSTWISSMDVYAEGTSPTTGAEVCYELAEPIIIPLTPTPIKSLNGINNLSVDCGEVIELEYFKEV